MMCVIFQHYVVFSVAGYEVTIGFVAGLPLVLLAARRIPWRSILVVWLALVTWTCLSALFAQDVVQASDFFNTFALVMVTSAIITIGLGGLHPAVAGSRVFWRTILLALAVVALYSLAQAISGAAGVGLLFNPWGAHQYNHLYDPGLAWVEIPRAAGFYLEPSYDAFVVGSLSVALFTAGRYTLAAGVFAVVGMSATQSATGLFLLLFIGVIFALRSRPAVTIAAAGAVVVVLAVLGPYLGNRLGSITQNGSSASYRLVQPLRVVEDVLTNHPLGLPLGSIYNVVARYGLEMFGSERNISLDNGIYVIMYYFGWLGVVAMLVLAVWAFWSAAKPRNQPHQWLVPIWLVCALLFSGGVVVPEFGIMIWLALTTFTTRRATERSFIDLASGVTPTIRGFGDLSRLGRHSAHARISR